MLRNMHVLIFFLLLVCTFNEGEFFWIVNKNISTEWETWGGFATCLSAIFTLITVFYAYTAFTNSNRALKSQQKAAERASFDATFTQMFAQHNILYTKNRCLRHKHCHFAEFVEFFERMSVKRKHSKKCTFYTLRFGCSFAAVNTIKPQLL